MFPPDDAAVPNEGKDASTEKDGGGKHDAGHDGRDAAADASSDAGRDASEAIDATIDSSTPAANHAPVAVNISVQTDEDMAVSDTLPASDADGDRISYEVVTQPTHGTVVLDAASGDITYTPAANFHGSDSFTFRASDGMDDSATATVEIEVLSVNDAPVATGSSLVGDEDTEINPLTLNASDVDGDTLTFTIVDPPSHGLLSGSGSTRIYTPDANFAGADMLTFRASDGKANSSTVTVSIEITAVNDSPTVTGDGIDVLEGGTATTLSSTKSSVLFNDSDVEGGLTASVVTGPAHGTLTLNADGTFSYTHDGSETTSDSFVYAACDDAATPACGNGTVNIAITAVDDAPVAAGDALTVAEGGTATMLAGGASSVIANDGEAEGETLTVNTTPTVAPAHGTLTLNANGTFSYTHDGSETTSDSFTYQVCDQAPVLCATATVSITITPVNEAPTANDDAIALNEGATATTVVNNGDDSVLDNDSDPDGDTLIASVVTAPTHGTLTLNADGTFSYAHDGSQTASDSFSYQACDAVTGGLCDSATVSISITLVNDAPVAVNDAIDLNEGATATTLAGGGTDLRANDTDEEGGALTVDTTPVTNPAHGTVTLNADGTFSYTHDGGETTSDSFQYSVCDSASACATGTVNVTVTPVNDAPLAVDDAVTVAEGGTVTMTSGASPSSDLRSNDVDPELQVLTVTATPVTSPTHGSLTLGADGTFSYTHDGSETTSDSFEYEVCDPSAACDIALVSITITPVNEAPVVGSETISVGEGLTVTVLDSTDDSVLDNDSDPDGDPLTAALVTGPAHGTLTLGADGTFSYTHDGSETTSDTFTYKACDDDAAQLCTSSAVAITIAPSNDAPTANDDDFTVAEGAVVAAGTLGSVLVNDTDPDSANLTASLWSSPSHGSATVNADGTFSYTHDGSEGGSDSFDYQVCDDAAVPACDIGTVKLTVTPVNDTPDAVDDVIAVNEGGTATQTSTLASSLIANDTDAEPGALTVTLVNPGPAHGTLTLGADGTFSYTHDGGETTSDDFQYTACDSGSLCDTANVHIVITPVNDTPVAGNDAIALNEGATATTLTGGGSDLRANDSDVESASSALSVTTTPVTNPQHGSVTLNADGTFSYTHDGSETTSDSFQYQVCDPNPGSQCATGTVTITVTPVNDAPIAGTDSIAVNEAGTATSLASGAGTDLRANDTDAESAFTALVVDTTLVVGPAHGTATVNADGTFSYTHDGSETTTDTFTYKVCDPSAACGNGVVNVAIVPVNEAPFAFVDTMTVNEGGTVVVLDGGKSSLLANDVDPDGDNLTATVDVQPAHGTVTINADGTFSYTHDGSETTLDTFTYKACDDDPIQLCGFAGVVVNVTPVNDNPVANTDGYNVDEGGALSVSAAGVLGNDTDAENGTLSASVVTGPLHAISFTLNADGSLSYVHDGSEGSSDSVTYKVCDNATPTPGCSNGTINFTIAPINDAPVAVDDAISVSEGASATTLVGGASSVGANDSDAENDPRSYALFGSTTAHGSLTLNGDGTFSYTHDGSENHSDGFDYEVCDGPSSCDQGHVAITVTPVNDPPVANDDAFTVAEGGTATSLTGGASSVLANDTDPDSTLTINTVTVSPQHASSFTLNPDGSFSYTHDGSETISDSFTYQTCDGALPTPACASATVAITVTPVDDPPVGNPDSATVAEGGTVTKNLGSGGVLDNDTDAEGNFTSASVVTGPAHASAFNLGLDGGYSYTHDGSETTSDSFTYKLCELNSPTTCSSATTVTITVTPVDDAPIANDDAITVNEGATATTLSPSGTDLRANDSDAESNAFTVVTTPVTAPAHGNLTLNANGTFSYTHDGGETTSDSFVYRICQTGAPALCDDGTVAITINPVNDAPVGGTYSYTNVVGNTLYTVNSSGLFDSSVKLGSLDTDAEAGSVLSITAMDATSANGGTITNLGSGAFTYLPPVGSRADDTFKYTISDNGTPVQSTQVTVTMKFTGPLIWYVDNSNAGPSDGRSSRPFTSLASADAAATPIADTRIYVATGTGTYNSPVSLVAGQTLHGAGDAFAPTTSVTFAAGTRPLISVAGNAVTVTSDNNVHGLNITSTGANAITGTGTSGTIAISNATLTASSGTGINITGASSIALSGLGTITAQSGIVTSGTTGLAASGGNAITTTNGPALDINGGTLNATFGAITSTTSSTFGVRIQNNASSPSFTASSITVSNPTGAGIAISGATGGSYTLGNCSVTQAGTAVTTVGDAYSLINSPSTSFTFSITADPATQNGRGLVVANTGTVTISSVPATFSATGGAAVDLTNAVGHVAGSGHWRFSALSSTNSSAQGIKLSTLSTPFEAQGTTTVNNAFSEGIRTDTTTGDLTFATVNVTNRRNAGIFINGANNSLVAFGAVTIPNPNTRSETAFTIQSSNANVSVLSTTIANAATALTLSGNTGGSFTLNSAGGVLGDGGTISDSTATAVSITNATDISLDDLIITNTTNKGTNGIDANTVDDFILRNSEVSKIGDADNEHAVALSAVTGSVLFEGDLITNMAGHGIQLQNSTGTTNLKVLASTISHNDAGTFCSGGPCSGDGLLATMNGNAALNLLVDNTKVEFIDTEGVEVLANSSGTVNATIRNSTFPNGSNGDSAIELDQSAGTLRYDVNNNTINGWSGHVVVGSAQAGSGTLVHDGTIRNNTIVGTPLFLNDGIRVLADLSGTVAFTGKVTITGNNVSKTDGRGIQTIIRGAVTGSVLHSRILGNTVSQTNSPDFQVVALNTTSACARVGDVTHAVASERNSAGAPTSGNAFQFQKAAAAPLFQLEGAVDAATEMPLANTGTTTTGTSGTITMVAAGTCQSPSLPTVPP